MKVTVPVGVPAAPLTVAFRVTLCPTYAGFGIQKREIVLGRPWMTSLNDAELAAKFPFAAYDAVMVCVPTGSDEVAYVATPPAFKVTAPSVIAPSENVTVPAGVPYDELTVALNVTFDPDNAGFSELAMVVVVGAATTMWVP